MGDEVEDMDSKLGVIVLLISLLFVIQGTIAAETWTPGVAAGDYFTYEMYGVYISNKPDVSLVIPQFEYNNTDWTRINITAVEGSVVYQLYTMHFKNGSETSFSFKSDTNPANMSSLKFTDKGVPLCAANLGVGDTVPTDEVLIDETVSRNYASGARETNHASWNSSNDWGDLYFDKQIGVLVELLRTHQFSSNTTDQIFWKTDVIKMVDSSKWEITEQSSPITPVFIVLTAFLFALLSLVIITYRLMTRKTLKRFPANRNEKLQINISFNYFWLRRRVL
jgi:hypothetical protein